MTVGKCGDSRRGGYWLTVHKSHFVLESELLIEHLHKLLQNMPPNLSLQALALDA